MAYRWLAVGGPTMCSSWGETGEGGTTREIDFTAPAAVDDTVPVTNEPSSLQTRVGTSNDFMYRSMWYGTLHRSTWKEYCYGYTRREKVKDMQSDDKKWIIYERYAICYRNPV